MKNLSLPIDKISTHYDVIVIGSGYGGAISASRLARTGKRVCLLERGREILPGAYPNDLPKLTAELGFNFASRLFETLEPKGLTNVLHNPTGMFQFHVDNEINVLVGCGLGGTSLINASVSLRPETCIFDDPSFPAELHPDAAGNLPEGLVRGFERAEGMLGAQLYPDSLPQPTKMRAHQVSAEFVNAPFTKVPINVTFEESTNKAGVVQAACTNCGDCITGCNFGAKNTVLMNYLPDAQQFGAEIFCEVRVDRIARAPSGHGFHVYYQLLDTGREKFGSPDLFVEADVVVLAAGTLGSTEILLRSRAAGLPLSDQLGYHFGGNGDMLAFSYNGDQPIHGVGFGTKTPNDLEPVGPTITSMIDMRTHCEGKDVASDHRMIMEEGSIPGALAAVLPEGFVLAAATVGKPTDDSIKNALRRKLRAAESGLLGAYHGATDHTQTYLVMVNDDQNGRMLLDDRASFAIDWPNVGKKPVFQLASQRVFQAADALNGVYVKDPLWSKAFKQSLITVHPMGGCVMGDRAEQGVCNHKGQVFAGTSGTDIHEGLYIADGSMIPCALGVNPLLTISALAERNAELLAAERGWTIDWSEATQHLIQTGRPKVGIRFTETMHGFFQPGEKDSYEDGAAQGKTHDNRFRFLLTIQSDDLYEMLNSPEHASICVGTVTAPPLHNKPLVVQGGIFNLIVPDPDRPGVKNMHYRLPMLTEDGQHYFMEGIKLLHDDAGFDAWTDCTTLYMNVYKGHDAGGELVGKGILRLTPMDFATQLSTIEVINALNSEEKTRALSAFAGRFTGSLANIYLHGLNKLIK